MAKSVKKEVNSIEQRRWHDSQESNLRIENWDADFPRLCLLKQFADAAGKGDFFSSLPDVLCNPLAHLYFTTIERDLRALDEDEWQVFRNGILELTSTKSGFKPRRALASLLNEAKGYMYLRNKGLAEINFIPRSTIETPELSATANGTIVALLEVKTAWQSDDENEWIEENTSNMERGQVPTGRRLSPSFPDGLKNKLKAHFQKAESQLRAYPAPKDCRRVAYFVIFLDYDQQNTPDITTQIKDYLSNLTLEIEIECDFPNAFT